MIASSEYYGEYYGHKIAHLEIAQQALRRGSGKKHDEIHEDEHRSLLFLIGDSTLDNK